MSGLRPRWCFRPQAAAGGGVGEMLVMDEQRVSGAVATEPPLVQAKR